MTNGRTSSANLNEKDILKLLTLLRTYSSKWCNIGLSLGFLPSELDTISSMSKLFVGAPVSYLQEILCQWIQWPTANHPTRPTLETLCVALQSSLVGLGCLADKVEKEMKRSTCESVKWGYLCIKILCYIHERLIVSLFISIQANIHTCTMNSSLYTMFYDTNEL